MLSLYYACSVPVMYAGTFTPRHKGIIQKKTISKIILISSSSSSKMVAINKATDTLSSQSSLSLRMTNSNTLASNDQTATIAAITPLPSVIKGRSDWREYRPFQLQNGIQCMLVHDKESKLTAMSVAVNVGASSDPRSMSGLAHFTEHMCFLGSAKYPGENEYKKYLSSHGGKSNASTSMSFTTFKFDVLAEHAEQAVDIFSQFFISPLFTKDGTTREVNAVDSENTRNIADDGRRRLQVLKALASPHHHFSKFSTGNKLTLAGVDIEGDENGSSHVGGFTKMRKAVIAFHRKHYKPENMVCVIVGPQTLDQLQEWIVPRFGVIETNVEKNASLENSITMDEDLQIEKLIDDAALDAPPTRYTDLLPPFNPAFSPQNQGVKWPIIVTMDPLKLQRKLVLLFPLPSVFKSPDTSPVAFISHLLGYEGAGSPFAVLQDAGLVNVISTGSRISAPDQCLFQVDISLTEKGEDQWKDVVQVIFQYIRLMEKTILDALTATTDTCHDLDAGTSKNNHESSYRSELHRIWDEIASIKSMNFNFTSPGNAYDFAPDLAQSIMSHGTKYCLTAGRTIADTAESRPSLPLHDIHSFVALMAPENCIIERFSKRAWEESNAVHSSSIHESTNGDLGSPFGVKQEKWYGVNYIVSSVDVDDISRWKTNRIRLRNDLTGTQENTKSSEASIMEMHLPKPNQFIPRSLELSHELPEEARVGPRIEKEMDPPDLISPYDDTKRLWHKLDDRYALPKSSFVLLLRNPYLEHSYDKTLGTWRYDEHFDLCSSLLLNMFSDGLSQATYDASLAGLSWSASKSSSGLSIACLGYSDRLPELALLLIQSFCGKIDGVDKGSVFLTENLFLAAKDRVTRSLQSYFQSGRADSHAFYYRDFILSGRGRGIDHKLELLSKITLSDIVQQRNRVLLYPGTEFDCLSTGNVPRGEAKDLFQKVCDILDSVSPSFNYEGFPGPMRWIPGPVARKLPSGDDVEIHFSSKNPEEQSGAVVMTFQSSRSGFKGPFLSPKNALKETAAVRLISHIMREPFFNELRTKQVSILLRLIVGMLTTVFVITISNPLFSYSNWDM